MSIRALAAKFPAEFAVVGRMLFGYTELELTLAQCVIAVGNDFDTVTKVLYQLRGETARISAADVFGRQKYDALGLGTEFSMSISYVRHLMKIRNQYAHSQWWDFDGSSLGFANMEEAAESNAKIADLTMLTRRVIDLPLLNAQEEFLENVERRLLWLSYEGQLLMGKLSQSPYPIKPKPLALPAEYIP